MTVVRETGSVPKAPVDPGLLERALRPFGQSTMLPAAAYTDPAVLAGRSLTPAV